MVHDGLVIVAPSDADAIFAFDAGSGRLLWKTEPIADDVKLSHVLGVAKGRLIVTGDRVLLFDVRNGKLAGVWPDSANKSLEGYGRGLLAGDLIYWPTRTEIQVLDQATGPEGRARRSSSRRRTTRPAATSPPATATSSWPSRTAWSSSARTAA